MPGLGGPRMLRQRRLASSQPHPQIPSRRARISSNARGLPTLARHEPMCPSTGPIAEAPRTRGGSVRPAAGRRRGAQTRRVPKGLLCDPEEQGAPTRGLRNSQVVPTSKTVRGPRAGPGRRPSGRSLVSRSSGAPGGPRTPRPARGVVTGNDRALRTSGDGTDNLIQRNLAHFAPREPQASDRGRQGASSGRLPPTTGGCRLV